MNENGRQKAERGWTNEGTTWYSRLCNSTSEDGQDLRVFKDSCTYCTCCNLVAKFVIHARTIKEVVVYCVAPN